MYNLAINWKTSGHAGNYEPRFKGNEDIDLATDISGGGTYYSNLTCWGYGKKGHPHRLCPEKGKNKGGNGETMATTTDSSNIATQSEIPPYL